MRLFSGVVRLFAFAIIPLLLVLSPARGQDASGRIVGNVTDQSGASVAGATVTVTNEGTKISQVTHTGKDGFYQVLSLPIGIYSTEIEMTGFRKQIFEHQSLEINQSLRLDAKLEIGTRTEAVEVEAQAPNVETVNPTLGESVTSRPLVNLPLNGRNTLDLALLQPGVMEANPDYVGGLGAGTFSVAGGRPDSITYLLDGGVNNDILANGVVLNPNPDSVAEFRILTSNYTAEYGRNGAGVISVVTKSGTNSIHGSAFEFLRNGDFDANTFFNKINGLPRDDLKRNQYGATLGGPITIPKVISGKDRFFFFVAYQGQRQIQTVVQSDIPTFTPAELQGNFSQAVPDGGSSTLANGTVVNCTTPGGCPDPNVAAFLAANPYFASPGGNAAEAIIDPTKINAVSQKYIAAGQIPTSPTGLISQGAPSMDNNNELTGKLDFLITPKDTVSFTLGGFRNPQFQPFGLNTSDVTGFPSIDQTNNYLGNAAYTRTFSAAVLNEFRFTAQRHNLEGDLPATTLPAPSSYGFGITPDLATGPPILFFDSGLTTGFSFQGPRHEISNAYGYSDTLTWIKGRNTWKFGAGLNFYQTNVVYDFFGNGAFTFVGPYANGGIGTGNSFADFDLGIPQSLFEGPNATNNLRSKAPYGFFQDEWRVKSNLTLTMGVRYEYSSPKMDTDGRTFSIIPGDQSTRFPNAPVGLVFPGDKGAPNGANFPDKTNFAPRFGFAWDPWKNGKTSVRGGFGIFYDILKGEDNLQFNGAPPFYSETGPSFNDGNPVGPGITTPFTYFSDPWAAYPGGSPFPSKPPTSGIDFVQSGFIPYNNGVGGGGLFFVDPHLHTPYSYQYNLSIQHEVAKNLTFEINYVGSSSKGLTALKDVNPFILGTDTRVLNQNQTNAEIVNFCAAQFSAADCPFAIIPEFTNSSFATYNSLETSLTRRLGDSRFFGTTYFTLGYTYGRSIDNASGFRNRTSQVPAYDASALRGPSDFDLAQRLTFSGGWDLPFDRAWASGPKRLTSGWSLYPILSWRTGFPLNVNAGLSGFPDVPGPSGAGDQYLADAVFNTGFSSVGILNAKNSATFNGLAGNYYFNPNTFSSNVTSAQPYGLPRNIFWGPGRTNLDLAMAKTTVIRENLKLEFRAEAFNVLNHTEFGNPDTNILSPTFGQITSTLLNSERILQLALRLTF